MKHGALYRILLFLNSSWTGDKAVPVDWDCSLWGNCLFEALKRRHRRFDETISLAMFCIHCPHFEQKHLRKLGQKTLCQIPLCHQCDPQLLFNHCKVLIVAHCCWLLCVENLNKLPCSLTICLVISWQKAVESISTVNSTTKCVYVFFNCLDILKKLLMRNKHAQTHTIFKNPSSIKDFLFCS